MSDPLQGDPPSEEQAVFVDDVEDITEEQEEVEVSEDWIDDAES